MKAIYWDNQFDLKADISPDLNEHQVWAGHGKLVAPKADLIVRNQPCVQYFSIKTPKPAITRRQTFAL